MRCVFVTGAGGFAGRHVRARLAAAGVELAELAGDVRDVDGLRRELAAARPDGVLHLAAAASVAEGVRRVQETWEVNATGSLHLLLAVADAAPEARVVL